MAKPNKTFVSSKNLVAGFAILLIINITTFVYLSDQQKKTDAALASFSQQLQETAKSLLETTSGLVAKTTELSDSIKRQDLDISQIQKELNIQKESIEKIEQEKAVQLENIENAKKTVVVIGYDAREDDRFLGMGEVQSLSITCSGVAYKITENTVYVVTNQHCIDWKYLGWDYFDPYEQGGPEIISETRSVSTIGGESHSAALVWQASGGIDLAVVKFEKSAGEKIFAAAPEPKLPSTGEAVVAIGAPSGLTYSVTQGIVSALRAQAFETGGKETDLVQTDAAVNQGNSGGGLFKLSDGKLVGINTFGIADTEGLNFAISIKSFLQLGAP